MTITEFNNKYRIEPLIKREGWGASVTYVLFDKDKGERVQFPGDVYGEFLRFHNIEDVLNWADEHSSKASA